MARALARSKYVALGGFYRRMAARRGGLVANKALARKLATLFWRVMVKGLDFVETGVAQYEAKVLETKHRILHRLARQLGQQILPNPAAVVRQRVHEERLVRHTDSAASRAQARFFTSLTLEKVMSSARSLV